jgi:hypothetical protein
VNVGVQVLSQLCVKLSIRIPSFSILALQPVHKLVFEGVSQKPIDRPDPLSIRADIGKFTVTRQAATFCIHVYF